MKTIVTLITAVLFWIGLLLVAGVPVAVGGILTLTAVLLFQGAFSTYSLAYTWLDPKKTYKSRAPVNTKFPERVTYSLLLPARHEEKVIGDTLRAMTRIDYPKGLYEVLVLVREDDRGTMAEVERVMGELRESGDKTHIRLVKFDEGPINKPYALNVGLAQAQHAFVGVFDAEDEPHSQILKKVEAVIQRKGADGVQSGVQLTNVATRWFTGLNCLEYFYWFRSVLPLFSKLGAVPLGGNTVFVRSVVLHRLGGWDEKCLTEDADIGIRISANGYKLCALYEEELVTLEEAPVTVGGFVRQRTRWDQGYMQVLTKGEWMKLPGSKQQFLTFYLLIQPLMRLVSVAGVVSLPMFAWWLKVPVAVAMLSFLPMYFWIVRLAMDQVALSSMARSFGIGINWWTRVTLVLAYYPYELMLSYSAVRAMMKYIKRSFVWEKTDHVNAHRLVGVEA